jgi:tape measure domain-containing protein
MATNPKIRYDIEAAVSGGSDVNALATQLEGLANTLEGDLKVQAEASAAALRELGAKQGAIENFRLLKTEAQSAAERLQQAQGAAQQLGAKLAASGAPTRAQAGQMQKLRDNVRAAKEELIKQNVALDQSRTSLRAAGVTTDTLAASERNVRAAIAAARVEVQQLAPAYTAAGNAAAEAGRKQAQSAATAGAGLRGLGDQLRTIQNIALTALGGSFVGSLAGDVAKVADEYSNLAARIRLVTGEGAAFESAFQGVQDIALATNSELEATGTLFTRIVQAGKEIGVTQKEALSLTETINQSIQLSGGSADSAKAAIIQLVQGLQSGVLRGDEFNSVMEQSPRLAKALADGLGKTTGELRAMAKEGRLTSEVVIRALQGQTDAVAAEFDKLPPTVGRAIQNLSTSWTIYVGEVDKATGASSAAAAAINGVAQNLDEIAAIATRAGAVLVAAMAVQAAGAVRAYIVQVAAATTATNLLTLSMSKVPTALKITIAAVGFEVGYQIGEMLRENSEYARKLGVAVVGFLEGNINALRGLKEAAAAIFTDDTVEAAFARYQLRNVELKAVLEQMWKDAEQSPAAIEAAAKKAAEATKSVGDAAVEAAKKTVVSAADIVEAWEASAISKRGDAQASEANLRVQLDLAKQSEAMAGLMGNEIGVRKARIAQMEIEIQLVLARANVARVEAEGSIAVAQAKLAEMKASGEVNLVKQAEIENSIKLAQAKIAEADATGKSADILRKQLELFKAGSSAGQRFGNTLDNLTGKQRSFAGATNEANAALERQAELANAKYSSPLGADKYSAPKGGSTTGNTREERLAGQNAVDNSLLFELRDKLRAGTLTSADSDSIRAAIAAIDQNAQIDRDVDRMNPGGFSAAGMADRREWAAIRTQLAQILEKTSVGRKVTVELKQGSQTRLVKTDEDGAAALISSLQSAALSAGL